MAESRAQFIITAVDKATATLRNINRRVSEMTQPARDVQRSFASLTREGGLYKVGRAAKTAGSAISNVGSEAMSLGAKLGAIGGIAGFAIKRGLIDTAAEFEKYKTMLETLEGSNAKASKSMNWVSDFAARTPFDLGEVMSAFVKLRTFGLDPTDGTLQAMVDQTAKMGGTADLLNGSILAVGQAWTKQKLQGEEALQLIERGVPVWDLLSKRMGKSVAEIQALSSKGKLGRDAIRMLVEEIGKSSLGASDKLSKTWTGIWSNIKDQWIRFANMIMDSGLFDWMKGKLQGVLDRINEMAANGKLAEWAKKTGDNIKKTLVELEAFAKGAWAVAKSLAAAMVWLRDLFGSWRPVILGIVAIMAGPLLLAMAVATKAVIALGIAIMGTPVGWIMAGIAGIAAAAYLIYRAWEPISKWWHGMIDSIGNALDRMVQRVAKGIAWLKGLVSWIPGMGADGTASAGAARGPVSTMGGRAQTVRYPGAAGRQAEVGGTIRVQIDSEGRPRVKEIRNNNRDVNFDVDAGMMMAGAH